VDTEVWWAEEAPRVGRPRPEAVSWHSRPRWHEGALEGVLVVRDLVEDVEGLVWSPLVPVAVTRQPEGRWWVDAGEGLTEGELEAEGIDWFSGSDGSHAYVVSSFLGRQARALRALLEEAPSDGGAPDPRALVEAIRGPSPDYKWQAVEALVAHQEEVTPHLLEVLDEVQQGLLEGSFSQDDFSGHYALVLLAHFRCQAAHERLLALARLPVRTFEEGLGGFLSEGFDAALLATCGGSAAGIRELARDRQVSGYLRSQAADALAGAVVLGHAPRGETLDLLAALMTPEEADWGDYLWAGVAGAMLSLFALEHEDLMVQACHEGLIEPLLMGPDDIRGMLEVGPAPAPSDLQCLERVLGGDLHWWMSWWACFRMGTR